MSEFEAVLLFFIFLFIVAIYIATMKMYQKIKIYQISSTYSIDEHNNPSKILEGFIAECFAEYQILFLIPRQEGYITDKREQEIIEDLGSMVSRRISPNLIDTLSQYYNKEKIGEIIGDKVYITVSSYVVENNLLKNQN